MLKKTTIVVVSVIILISIILLSYQSRGNGHIPKINPSQLISPLVYLRDTIDDFFNLREENEALKKKIYNALLEQSSYQELISENRRLKSLLGLKEYRKDIATYAKIVSRGSNRFFKTVWIDKGSKDGISQGMAVVGINGLLGKVLTTTAGSSEVILITDPNFSVSTRIERTRVEGIVSGAVNRCVLKYIPLEEEVLVGDRLITSGLDGVFPEGIPVGVVSSVTKREGLFQKIDIIPFQSPQKTEEVAILRKIP